MAISHWSAQSVWALRTALRMTQKTFGEHITVAERTVRAWEAGATISSNSQQLLDTALEQADTDAKIRFSMLAKRKTSK
jgi:8-oxo-dGTP diphosphatase